MGSMKQASETYKRAGFCRHELDDANLTLAEFRIYMHLIRRAGSGGDAFPGVDSITRVCRMSKPTAIKTIRALQSYGMITVQKEDGKRNHYTIIHDPENWSPTGKKEVTHQSNPGNVRSTNKKEYCTGTGTVMLVPVAGTTEPPTPLKGERVPKKVFNKPIQIELPIEIETELPVALKRCCALFRKRDSTPLSQSEKRAWQFARRIVELTSTAEWELLEWEYSCCDEEVIRFRRQDLATLLNHWNEEISRAATRKAKFNYT